LVGDRVGLGGAAGAEEVRVHGGETGVVVHVACDVRDLSDVNAAREPGPELLEQ
jgi:hypothetical protein